MRRTGGNIVRRRPRRAGGPRLAACLAAGLAAVLFPGVAPAQPVSLSEDRPATAADARGEADRFVRTARFEAPIATPTRAWMTADGTVVAASVGSLAYYNTPRDEQYLERLLRERAQLAAVRMILVGRYEGVRDPEALWTGLAMREGGVRLRAALPRLGSMRADRTDRRLWMTYSVRADDPALAQGGGLGAWGLPDLTRDEVLALQARGWLARARELAARGRSEAALESFLRAMPVLELSRRDLLEVGFASALGAARLIVDRGEDADAELMMALRLLRAGARAADGPVRTITIAADARIAERVERDLGVLFIDAGREDAEGNGVLTVSFSGSDQALVGFLDRLDALQRAMGQDRPGRRVSIPAEGLIAVMPLPGRAAGAHDGMDGPPAADDDDASRTGGSRSEDPVGGG